MDRWSGVLKIQLSPNTSTFYRVAASLALSSSSKNLAVPSGNAIFFNGDRVEGTRNPVIERLSNPQRIAEILVSKFGGSINAFVVEASVFNGPFAVYKDFVPSINEYGEPQSFDATGFPASTSLVLLLSKFLEEARTLILGKQKEPYQAEASTSFSCKPKTAVLGFSKGGTVLNQLITEFSLSEVQSTEIPSQANKNVANGGPATKDDWIIPTSKERLFNSIVEIHYVDVGLNTKGAYLTDKEVIDRFSECLSRSASSIRFLFHGTPRQWCDERRIWIRKEKDALVRLLKRAAQKNMGKLLLRERLYFPGKNPDLQMHFEIIEVMDVN
ncbi:Conserved developmentally regulated protein [Handroanthus impetiginosus]|uniref:Conserved developmentally regulated protein n=1 Tax=Handroanthus impetiginosus TaxID=429701 RepID=A0A2G9G210_9LAMI|nr:Conserved developmentally regulated protein [Handroanthus impetiginosus]